MIENACSSRRCVVVKSRCSVESVVAVGEQESFSNRTWPCPCLQMTGVARVSLFFFAYSDVEWKTICCLTTDRIDCLHHRHASALALSSRRFRFPGFTTGRCKVLFRSAALQGYSRGRGQLMADRALSFSTFLVASSKVCCLSDY